MDGHDERLDRAVAEWLSICERHGTPFKVIEAAQLAYDAGNDLEPPPELGCLRALAVVLFGFAKKTEGGQADWEVIPLLLGRVATAGFILGRQYKRSLETRQEPPA